MNEAQNTYQAHLAARAAAIAASHANPSIEQVRFDAMKEKAAAKRQSIAAAETVGCQAKAPEIILATEAQVSYLVSLLPRLYEIKSDDGIRWESAVWEIGGGLKMAGIRSLTKTEASEWITEAKKEIAAS